MHLNQNDCKRVRFWQSPQLLFFMKMSFVLTTLICMHLGVVAHTQNTISLTVKKERLKNVFELIERQSEYRFLYNDNPVIENKKITLKMQEASLEKVMDRLLEGTGLLYKLKANNLVILSLPSTEKMDEAPYKVITGKVIDEKGNPLVGVSVAIKGTSQGTTTGNDGSFSIDVNPGDVLSFSFVGYEDQDIKVGSQLSITCTLKPSGEQMGEVVVTALGIKKEKKKLGYAVTELQGSDFTQAREPNLANALSGKVAGVNVVKPATGAFGSSRVIIRGNGSISGNNQPLYVVNGIPIDNTTFGQPSDIYGGADGGDGIGDINPDDVETITVLKGATAAALYGSRASNGAIVITTKKGVARKGAGVELNSVYTMETPIVFTDRDYQYEYGQGLDGQAPQTKDEAFDLGIANWGGKLDGSSVVQYDGVNRPYSPVKDNIKNFYKNANTFTNTVSTFGGNENTTFRFSASDMNNHDLFPNSGIRRNNFSLNAGTKLGSRLTINATAMYVRERVKNRQRVNDSDGSGNWLIYQLPTNVDVRTLDKQVYPDGQEYQFSSNIYAANPYFIAYHYVSNDEKDRWIANAEAKYDFTRSLYARVRLGNDNISRHSTFVRPWGSAVARKGSMSENMTTITEFNAEGIIGYNNNVSPDFSVNVFAGGNIMTRSNKSLNGGGNEFIVPNFNSINNLKSFSSSYYLNEKEINSLFAFGELGYKNQLFLTLTGRNDWFSTLDPRNNNIFYPSVGLSYVLSDGMALPSWISFAKLRGAWAQAGGDTDPYALDLTYRLDGSMFDQPLGYINESTIPNKNLRPLTSTTTEAGFEAKFFNSRLGIDFTWYNRVTTNDILSSTISQTSGFDNVRLNVGEIKNSGIELLITGTPVRTSKLSWDVAFNMGYNQSRIKELADGKTSFTVATSRPGYWGDAGVPAYIVQEVGQPYGIIKGYTYKRDAAGNIIYGADGLPIKGDIGKLGNGVAPLTLGFTNSLSYNNFTLSVLLDGKFGGKIASATNNFAYATGLHKNTLVGRESGVVGKGVTEDGHPNEVNVPAQQYYYYLANNITEEFIFDASFLKLRQVVLGYSLPKRIVDKTPFTGLSFSLVARNLATLISHVPIVDPESAYTTGNIQGFEMLSLPATRSWGVNLNIKF